MVSDLYIMIYEFYRTREKDLARINAELLITLSGSALFFNVLQLVEIVTGSGRILPHLNRKELWLYSVPILLLLIFLTRWYVSRHPILQSAELMRARHVRLGPRRKLVLLSAVIGNILLVFLIAQLR